MYDIYGDPFSFNANRASNVNLYLPSELSVFLYCISSHEHELIVISFNMLVNVAHKIFLDSLRMCIIEKRVHTNSSLVFNRVFVY